MVQILRQKGLDDGHPPPHFHVYYNEYRATVDIRTCEIMEGELPRKQARLAKENGPRNKKTGSGQDNVL